MGVRKVSLLRGERLPLEITLKQQSELDIARKAYYPG